VRKLLIIIAVDGQPGIIMATLESPELIFTGMSLAVSVLIARPVGAT